MTTIARTTLLLCAFAWGGASAAEPPDYMRETLPEQAIEHILGGYAALQGDDAALDARTRELLAIGVAAQIPCRYCVHSHTQNALEAGATEEQIREAIAMAGYIRLFSTVLHGNAYDFDKFAAERERLMAGN